nr:MAG TPA_asm: hypothetical protein [Caudoviricetes sp.]
MSFRKFRVIKRLGTEKLLLRIFVPPGFSGS